MSDFFELIEDVVFIDLSRVSIVEKSINSENGELGIKFVYYTDTSETKKIDADWRVVWFKTQEERDRVWTSLRSHILYGNNKACSM